MLTRNSTILVLLAIFCAAAQSQPFSAEDLGPAPLLRPGDGAHLPDGFFTGRISAIATSPTDPNKYFVGGPGSGVWRFEAPAATPNDYTWTPLTDDMPALAIGALAIDPNDEDIVYAGAGDPNFAQHSPMASGSTRPPTAAPPGRTWPSPPSEAAASRGS